MKKSLLCLTKQNTSNFSSKNEFSLTLKSLLIGYINFLVFWVKKKNNNKKIDAHIKSEEPIYELVPSCLWKRPFVTKCYWPRRVAISLGGCFEEKEGIRVDGWNVKATQMEIMAGKFDASSSPTIILVAIYYFRVLSFWLELEK